MQIGFSSKLHSKMYSDSFYTLNFTITFHFLDIFYNIFKPIIILIIFTHCYKIRADSQFCPHTVIHAHQNWAFYVLLILLMFCASGCLYHI